MVNAAASLPIRRAATADLAEALVLNNAHVPAVSPLHADELDWFQREAHGLWVVTDPRAGLLGLLITLIGPGSSYPSLNYDWFCQRFERFLYVDRIVVAVAGQGRGLGQRFYREVAVAEATALGLKRVCAEVNLEPRNDQSLRFHAAFGFAEVGQRHDHHGKLLSMQVLELG